MTEKTVAALTAYYKVAGNTVACGTDGACSTNAGQETVCGEFKLGDDVLKNNVCVYKTQCETFAPVGDLKDSDDKAIQLETYCASVKLMLASAASLMAVTYAL